MPAKACNSLDLRAHPESIVSPEYHARPSSDRGKFAASQRGENALSRTAVNVALGAQAENEKVPGRFGLTP
jgi:hypothetical protein